jgi:putative two-component system response regulator
MRLLLVDDDSGFRALLRTTFEDVHVDVDEAGSAAEAEERIAATMPDVIVLDVGMPGMDGLAFCRELKAGADTRSIRIVLLTGMEDVEDVAGAAGADALLLKPFRPLELLGVVERLAGASVGAPMRRSPDQSGEEQLVLYARDLRHLVEIERAQRGLLESAYRETVSALATALGTKDTGTRQHSQRVQRYALELAALIDPALAADPALEYGFLLHDIGKIGVPDHILLKKGRLNDEEQVIMRKHVDYGVELLDNHPAHVLQVACSIAQNHHEKWDGSGYPNALAGEAIPIAARIVAICDVFDALTSVRPYKVAWTVESAVGFLQEQAGSHFDPNLVALFLNILPEVEAIRERFSDPIDVHHEPPRRSA